MSIFLKNQDYGRSLAIPDVKILHSGDCLVAAEWNIDNRNQPFWVFYWNETPGAETIFEHRRVALTPDKVLLVPPHTTFSSRRCHSFRHFFLHFAAGAPFNRVRRKEIILDSGPYRERLREKSADPCFDALRKYEIVYSVLSHLPPECFATASEPVMDPRILKSLELMAASRQGEFIDNQEICRRIGMSVSNYQRLFKEEMKMSPMRYFLNRRLERAKYLLIHSKQEIAEIALETGFADRFHFSKAFKTLFHIAPAELRKRNSTGEVF